MNLKTSIAFCLLIILAACEQQPLVVVGQLESDRVELVVEVSEPLIAIDVVEGDWLEAGAVLARQDSSRVDLQIEEVIANRQRIEALLQEQLNGPRPETIAVVQASLHEIEIERDFRGRELARLSSLRARNLTSVESVDSAQNALDRASAQIANIQAQLTELRAGTRVEQIEQTRSSMQQLEIQLQSLQLNRQRLQITAPVTGIVDSLPFEVGERPRPGDVVAVMLTGSQPYARLYLPETVRTSIRVGSTLELTMDGLEGSLVGTVRRVANEPSFTPYFALTERDRGRLSYVTEVEIPDRQERLPEGLPVQTVFH